MPPSPNGHRLHACVRDAILSQQLIFLQELWRSIANLTWCFPARADMGQEPHQTLAVVLDDVHGRKCSEDSEMLSPGSASAGSHRCKAAS